MTEISQEALENAVRDLVYHRTSGRSGSGYMPNGEYNHYAEPARRHITEVLKSLQPAIKVQILAARQEAQAQVLAGVKERLLDEAERLEAKQFESPGAKAILDAIDNIATLNPSDTERPVDATPDVAFHKGRLEGALGILEGDGEFNREGLVELLREAIAGLCADQEIDRAEGEGRR